MMPQRDGDNWLTMGRQKLQAAQAHGLAFRVRFYNEVIWVKITVGLSPIKDCPGLVEFFVQSIDGTRSFRVVHDEREQKVFVVEDVSKG